MEFQTTTERNEWFINFTWTKRRQFTVHYLQYN
jgi:hypothetical protein